ncbi:sensor domain-containing protein [Mycolicibacterium xanthum]|uniref:sensor domain-containing protein n=1 Tax=Mycolicibacterium xanthum TaxID=2796469 RepID=UPI0027E1DE76|nr:sensor domain-containing protein [Mycolicibacterium xanthum]
MGVLIRGKRVGAALAVTTLSVWLAGCTATVDGTAVRPSGAAQPNLSPLEEDDLEDILLSAAELNELLGSEDIEIDDELDDMTDDADDVSDPECVGAIFSAEEPVYSDTGYTAVATRLASEPGDDYDHWVEETVVLLPSADDAEAFLERSAREWDRCAGRTLSLSDGADWFDWELHEVVRDGGIISQMATMADSDGWECQHALGAASTAVIEGFVCSYRIRDQGVELVAEMIGNAEER